jgi:serine/threonine protein kinase
VKILDFGLAKQTPTESAAQESPTMTVPAPTIPGTVMGTAGYMSPEQGISVSIIPLSSSRAIRRISEGKARRLRR